MASNIQRHTSKEKECILYFKYKYYKKGECNKDISQRFFAVVKNAAAQLLN